MIYDCFTYFNELELFIIRYNELMEIPNLVHVIVQSNKTFTNKPNPVTHFFEESEKRVGGICVPDMSRFRIIYVEDMPEGEDNWARERHQRNAIMRGLTEAKDDDIVIISDADEITFAHSILKYKPEMQTTALVMNKTGYWLNCIEGYQSWKIAKILTYGILKQSSPDAVRNAGQESFIENAGWHFSYLGGTESIKRKLEGFSHQDANTNELKSKLDMKIFTGQSLWSDKPDDLWKFIPIDNSFPKFIVEEQNGFVKHLIKQI